MELSVGDWAALGGDAGRGRIERASGADAGWDSAQVIIHSLGYNQQFPSPIGPEIIY